MPSSAGAFCVIELPQRSCRFAHPTAGGGTLRRMNFRLFASTFGLIFLAELGDKTQLATLSLAATGESRGTVFLAAATALVVTSAIGVLAGEALAQIVPTVWISRVAGVGFVAMGAYMLLGRK